MTKDEIREVFIYDKKASALRWKIKPRFGISIGDIAGGVSGNGYIRIGYGNKRYYAHNLIWIYHNGEIPDGLTVDHKDRNRTNNAISNLRLLNGSGQNANQNHLGFSYVVDKRVRSWKTRIFTTPPKPWRVKIKKKYVGHYSHAFVARLMYELAAIDVHGDAFLDRWAYGMYLGILKIAFS